MNFKTEIIIHNPNMNLNVNTIFLILNFQKSSNMNQNNSNIYLMNSNSNIAMLMAQSYVFNRKLHVQLTREEKIFYNKLYNMLYNNQRKFLGKSMANFMKTSGLEKNMLKKI